MEKLTAPQPPITTWSFSRLQIFEKCPLRLRMQVVDKVERPPEKKDAPNVRGKAVHDAAEAYVRGTAPMPKEMKKFEDELTALKEAFPQGDIILEEDWGIDINWAPCGFFEKGVVWGRSKLDVFHRLTPESARIIDYKTGKKFGNEVSHTQQGQLYMMTAFMRFPELEYVTVEFWYTDEGKKTTKQYVRDQMALFLPKMEARALKLTKALIFEPKPSRGNCKFCPYGPNKDGNNTCAYGIPEA
jgi:RecB family exonuclease